MGGVEASLVAFATAGVVIVLLLFGLAAAMASAQERVVATLQAGVLQIKRWGGVILIAVGLWTLASAIWAEAFARFFPV
jgi:cytochrome c biogenesis protein CcdA